jgi:hypothetical protein
MVVTRLAGMLARVVRKGRMAENPLATSDESLATVATLVVPPVVPVVVAGGAVQRDTTKPIGNQTAAFTRLRRSM